MKINFWKVIAFHFLLNLSKSTVKEKMARRRERRMERIGNEKRVFLQERLFSSVGCCVSIRFISRRKTPQMGREKMGFLGKRPVLRKEAPRCFLRWHRVPLLLQTRGG